MLCQLFASCGDGFLCKLVIVSSVFNNDTVQTDELVAIKAENVFVPRDLHVLVAAGF